jgi:hypothetical protein
LALYVVTQPESIKAIYDTWDACKAAVDGVKGARYQKVHDIEEAKALIEGEGLVLSPGLHVFSPTETPEAVWGWRSCGCRKSLPTILLS